MPGMPWAGALAGLAPGAQTHPPARPAEPPEPLSHQVTCTATITLPVPVIHTVNDQPSGSLAGHPWL